MSGREAWVGGDRRFEEGDGRVHALRCGPERQCYAALHTLPGVELHR